MAVATEAASLPPDVSPALQQFLKEDAGRKAGEAEGEGFSLGDNLDITSSQVTLAGLEDQIEHFADHDVLKAILDQGCDPKEYQREYEIKLRQAELESIQDYIGESDNLVTLHQQISACDGILAVMEAMLGRFQADLGNISTEIRTLQEQSHSMSVKLRNRKGTEEALAGFIESIALPGPLVEGVVSGEVDERFLQHLQLLDQKLTFLRTDAAQGSLAYKDVQPEVESLKAKAVGKAREYLLSKIYQLRKPKTNIQILQQNLLLRHRYLVAFLRAHATDLFAEVRSAYVDTLSKVLSTHFRAYITALERLQAEGPKATDLIGAAEAAPAGVMSIFKGAAGAASAFDKGDAFALGERGAIVLHLDQPAVIPHVLEAEKRTLPWEVLFRSVNKLLMDTATSEYLFCCDFFQEDTVFHELFAPTLSVVESTLQAKVTEMFDMIALLLMIRINYHHRLIMNKRRIPCLDDYLDRVNLMLWPRFKVVFDLQLGSIKNFNVATQFNQEFRVHPVTQRYAQLTSSLLLLNADYSDGQLGHNIDRMRYQVMDLLIKMSRSYKQKRLATIFLVINFHHTATAFREAAARGMQAQSGKGGGGGNSLGAVGTETVKEFEDQLATCTNLYVDEQLGVHFGELLAFIKKAEHVQKQQGVPEGQPLPGFGPAEAAPIVRSFAAKWTSAIEALQRDVLKDFKHSVCGREVLKAAMTQLLLYYTRLLELLKKAGPDGMALVRDAVTVPSIMFEIKRYNR